MSILERLAKRLGFVRETAGAGWPVKTRAYAAADVGRLFADWSFSNTTADVEVKGAIKTAREKSRDLERNDDYVRRYLKLVDNNVVGSTGIGLQMKIREVVQAGGKWTERYDKLANDIIEAAWWRWGRPENCSVLGNLWWLDLQRLALRTVVRDGAAFFRYHYPRSNPFRFALEPMEADHLDTDFSASEKGRVVRLGVEYDEAGRVAAYHVLRNHPGDQFQPMLNGRWRERIPAEQILHLYRPDRFGQSTGMPWICAAVNRLRHLGKYEEAEVVAARAAAAKMGFLESVPGSPGTGYNGAEDEIGNKYMDVEPGTIEELPIGKTFKAFDPTHPNAIFSDFVKAQLRGIAAGLGVSYVSLANDLESVNYSSIRAGLLEEREEWKTVQAWFIGHFITPVFENWLKMASATGQLTNGRVTLPDTKLDKWNAPEWKPRRWPWVDPLKDIQASVTAVKEGFTSRRAVIADAGGDVEDVFSDIAADEDLAEEKGLEFGEKQEQQPLTKEEDIDDGK